MSDTIYIDPYSHPDDKDTLAQGKESDNDDFISGLPAGWMAYHIGHTIEVFNGKYRIQIHDGDARVYKPLGKAVLKSSEDDTLGQILEAIRLVERFKS